MSMPKRALIVALSAAGLLAGPAAVRAVESPAEGAATTRPAVTRVEAVCQEGRTYVVFRKANQAEGNYLLYRGSAPIKDLTGLSPIAKVPRLSHAHPDNGTAFVVLGDSPLTESDGLFVYTPKKKERAWYCVVPESVQADPLIPGRNVTTQPVEEVPSDHPGAIFQRHDKFPDYEADTFASWMDYDTWANDKEYYGSFFTVSYDQEMLGLKEPGPLVVYMHSLGMGRTGEPARMHYKGYYTIRLIDHKRTWWAGRTEGRVNVQVDYILGCGRYNLDRERVYVTGSSMGGRGSMLHALKYPDRYAAAYTILPQFLDEQVPQTAVSANLPPITTYWGFRDSGPFGAKGNVPFLKRMNECKHAVWSRWGDHGHADPTGFDRDTMIPGGVFRFKRNELHPVFLNTLTDDNCGQRGAENVHPAGSINTGIDWASGLHSLKLDGEALADKEDELAVTFLAGQDCTTDLAFRRVQRFKPAAKTVLSYKNIAVADGKLLQEGNVTVPEDLIWVLKGIQMTKAGNRVAVRVSAK